jgi:hydrogenase/urease accessory protein HupE
MLRALIRGTWRSMFTVSRLWIVATIFVLTASISSPANAHPIAQGAMQITVAPQSIQVRITVSLEEVSVANAYGPAARISSPAEAAKQHGDYLLRHFVVTADGRVLRGRLVAGPDAAPGNRFRYDLEYPIGRATSSLRFEENVLNEFDFAPGNRWEASYVVEITEGAERREGLLLTSRQPLIYHRADAASSAAPRSQLNRWRTIRDYGRHGLMHILAGYDHLLFITALVLTVRSLWELVKVVSAFTLAHSITLTLAAFDLVRVPSRFVEPVIAASIVFVALQNIFWPERTHGWTRLAVAFGFGLFHGLGFAGGLLNAMQGMSTNSLVAAIVGFSVGVEAGHQVVVIPTLLGLKIARRWSAQSRNGDARFLFLTRCGSAAISLAGAIYLGAALRAW